MLPARRRSTEPESPGRLDAERTLLAVGGDSIETRTRARPAIASLLGGMESGRPGPLPERFEPEPPFRAVAAPAQAWSVAEVLRIIVRIGEA